MECAVTRFLINKCKNSTGNSERRLGTFIMGKNHWKASSNFEDVRKKFPEQWPQCRAHGSQNNIGKFLAVRDLEESVVIFKLSKLASYLSYGTTTHS